MGAAHRSDMACTHPLHKLAIRFRLKGIGKVPLQTTRNTVIAWRSVPMHGGLTPTSSDLGASGGVFLDVD